MIVGAHAILHLAFSCLPCGFGATNLYQCRRPSEAKIWSSHVVRFSFSELQHAYK